MPYRKTIAEAYDAGVEEEFLRLTETPLREAEYELIVELLNEYIADGSTIIDIGSGPGRYAEHLLNRNCNVGVVDLSAKSLKAFSDRMLNTCCNDKIIFNEVSCATQLDWIEDNSADAILLMGPLYHLVNNKHREIALSHCFRILKSGGRIFSVFLSPYPILKNTHHNILNKPKEENIIPEGITYTKFKGYDVAQFRCWPCEALRIMEQTGFSTTKIRNLEGVGSFISDSELNELNEPEKKAVFFNMLRNTCEIPNLLGITHQYLYVGTKK